MLDLNLIDRIHTTVGSIQTKARDISEYHEGRHDVLEELGAFRARMQEMDDILQERAADEALADMEVLSDEAYGI